ncbi:hypothetical protein J6590_080970 [Homalodisca vitripennis]|nr:hypothetical protein J6590_080970 [Homalodisca vitripennis]
MNMCSADPICLDKCTLPTTSPFCALHNVQRLFLDTEVNFIFQHGSLEALRNETETRRLTAVYYLRHTTVCAYRFTAHSCALCWSLDLIRDWMAPVNVCSEALRNETETRRLTAVYYLRHTTVCAYLFTALCTMLIVRSN